MISDTIMMTGDEEIMLQEADFPDYFIDKHHPDDYKPINKPLSELIYHVMPDHNRLILRICFKITDTMYIPVTFVCDTGAPSHIYVNSLTRRLIKTLILTDATGSQILKIGKDKIPMLLKPSPAHHPDVNIIGLLALLKFGITANEDDTFAFTRLPKYL